MEVLCTAKMNFIKKEAKSIIAYKLKNIRIVSVCDGCKRSIDKYRYGNSHIGINTSDKKFNQIFN